MDFSGEDKASAVKFCTVVHGRPVREYPILGNLFPQKPKIGKSDTSGKYCRYILVPSTPNPRHVWIYGRPRRRTYLLWLSCTLLPTPTVVTKTGFLPTFVCLFFPRSLHGKFHVFSHGIPWGSVIKSVVSPKSSTRAVTTVKEAYQCYITSTKFTPITFMWVHVTRPVTVAEVMLFWLRGLSAVKINEEYYNYNYNYNFFIINYNYN